MQTVQVHTKQRDYTVYIGETLLSQAGEYVGKVHKPCRCVLVSDSNVAPLYAEKVRNSLREAGFESDLFVFPAGEASKNLQTFGSLLSFCAERGLTRSDILLALGGGVTGDLTGFAASCYQRGIAYVQLPTSLLAMVDSSVGGKTAVDLDCGKNLVGAFHQPSLVLCDTSVLSSLPPAYFTDGMAEVIKYGFIGDSGLLRMLSALPERTMTDEIIYRCVRMKSETVAADENDKGIRQILNYGHTVGHAVECLSGYTLSHGRSVAIGMHCMAVACRKTGIGADIVAQTDAVLHQFGLPSECPYEAGDILRCVYADKKRQGNEMTLAIPTAPGKSGLLTVSLEKSMEIIRAGVEK